MLAQFLTGIMGKGIRGVMGVFSPRAPSPQQQSQVNPLTGRPSIVQQVSTPPQVQAPQAPRVSVPVQQPVQPTPQPLGRYGDTSLRAPTSTLRAPVQSDRTTRSDLLNFIQSTPNLMGAGRDVAQSVGNFFTSASEFQRQRVADEGPVKGTALGLRDLATGSLGGLYNPIRSGFQNLEQMASEKSGRLTGGLMSTPRLAQNLPEFQSDNPFQQMFQTAGEAGIYTAPSAGISARGAHLSRAQRAGISAGGDVAIDMATQGELTPMGAAAAGIGAGIEALTPSRLRGGVRGLADLVDEAPIAARQARQVQDALPATRPQAVAPREAESPPLMLPEPGGSNALSNFIGKGARTFRADQAVLAPDMNFKNIIRADDIKIKRPKDFDDFIENNFPDEYMALNSEALASMANKGDEIARSLLRARTGIRLGSIVDYPEFFKAYPEAKNIRLRISKMNPYGGSFSATSTRGPRLEIGAYAYDNPARLKEVLKHELQHFVQLKEVWGRGGSVESANLADIQNIILRSQRDNMWSDPKARSVSFVEDFDYINQLIEKTKQGVPLTAKEKINIFGTQKEFEKASKQVYRNLYGEAEANANKLSDIPSQTIIAPRKDESLIYSLPTRDADPVAPVQAEAPLSRVDQFIRGTEDITRPVSRFDETIPTRLEVSPTAEKSLAVGRVKVAQRQANTWMTNFGRDLKATGRTLELNEQELYKLIDNYAVGRTTKERSLVGAVKEKELARANKKLEEFEALPKKVQAEVKRLQQEITKFSRETLNILRDNKLISKEEYDRLINNFSEHVNLYRELVEKGLSPQQFRGVGIKGSGLKQAKGSDLETRRIIDNVVEARIAAVSRAEQNNVLRALAKRGEEMTRSMPDQQMIRVTNPKQKTDLFTKQNIEDMKARNQLPFVDRDGKQRILQLDNDTMLAFSQLRRGGELAAKAEWLEKKIRSLINATKGVSQLYTRFNLPFLTNQNFMDLTEGMAMAMSKDASFKQLAKMPPKQVQATKDIFDYIRGANTPGAKKYEEFVELGGSSGSPALGSREEIAKSFDDILSSNSNVAKRGFKALIKQLDDYGEIMDNATRFNLYQQGLDQGMTKKQAAWYSKSTSGVDFDLSGSWGPTLNTFFMFANVALKSNTRMFRNVYAKPKVLAKVTAGMAALNEGRKAWNDAVDPDWRASVTEWDENNGFPLIVPFLGEEGVETFYIPFRVGWGLRPLKHLVEIPDRIASGVYTPQTAAKAQTKSFLESFNVLGGAEFNIMDSTILAPFFQIARNENFMGNQIRPTFGNEKYFPHLEDDWKGKYLIKFQHFIENVMGSELGDKNPFNAANLNTIIEHYGAAPLRQLEGVAKNLYEAVKEGPSFPTFGVLKKRTADQARDPEGGRLTRIAEEETFGLKSINRKEQRNVKKILAEIDKKLEGKDFNAKKTNDLINALSDEAYEKFEKLRPEHTAERILEIAKKDKSRANNLINSLTDDEYKVFEKALNKSKLSREEQRLGNLSLRERAQVIVRLRNESEASVEKQKEFNEMYDRLEDASIITPNLEKIILELITTK